MFEAIVVGAGPAGSAAATILASKKKKVLLLDRVKFPRDKPCGDIISSSATMELERLGVWSKVSDVCPRPIHSVLLISPNGSSIELKLSLGPQNRNFAAPRAILDNLLREYAIESGAEFRVLQVIMPIIERGRVNGVVVRSDNGLLELRAPITIAADGASSILATNLFGKNHFLQQKGIALRGYLETQNTLDFKLLIYFFRDLMPGYAWMVPINNKLANIGVGTTVNQYRRVGYPLKTFLSEFLEILCTRFNLRPKGEFEHLASWFVNLGPNNISRSYSGILFVGDAGSFVNPATAEGIANAIMTGRVGAEIAYSALSAGEQRDEVLSQFDRKWETALLGQLQRAAIVKNLLLSRPGFMNWLFGIFSKQTHIAENTIRWITKFI